MIVGKAAIKLEFTQVASVGGRGQVVAHHHQSLCAHGYSEGQQSQSNHENCLSHTDPCWLADYGVPRIEIDKQTMEALLDR